jgi:predicted MFS family arabinose efflux permease
VPRWIFALVQFLPLSLFASYAFWLGAPDGNRWQEAFQLASVAALVQLAIVLPQRRPASRLVLAANLYLLLGGLAFFTQQWWFLQLYDSLRESAIFMLMLAVGIVTTFGSRAGFVATCSVPRPSVIRASAWLLAATAVALVISMEYRGDRYLAAVYPIIGLAVLQRVLLHRLARQHGAAANNSPEPTPLRGAAN